MMKLGLAILLCTMVFLMPFTVNGASSVIYDETIDSINGIRYENYLVYFDFNETTKTGTNVWGYEISVDQNNVVIETSTNVTMVPGGYALSAHGTKKIGLQEVTVGDIVELDLNHMSVTIFRDPVESSYFRSLSNLEKARETYQSAQTSYIIIDMVSVDAMITGIEEDFQTLSELYQKDTLTPAEETEMVTIAYQIQKDTESLIYQTSFTSSIEIRAMWHRPNASSIKEYDLEGLIRFMDRVQELGFNTIYLETFWNGFLSYRSEILDTHPTLTNYTYGEEYGNDYVKAFIGEASKRGIDVHAWIHTFNAGNVTYLSDKINSDWLLEDYQGNTLHPNDYGGSYYMDPSNPEVIDFVNSLLTEMATNYDFAGIQLDYIRYYDNNYNHDPIRDSGYGSGPETRFKDAYLLSGDVRTLILDETNRQKWNAWRQENVTEAVASFSETIHSVNPEMIVSADVVADISQARNIYMQDWLTWVRKGYIDLLCPMIYTSSVDRVATLSENISDQIGNLSFLSSGIASVYYGYPVLTQHLQMLAASPFGGNAIFASQNVISNPEVESQLKDGIYRNPAITPFSSVSDLISFVVNIMTPLVETKVEDQTVKNMFLSKFAELTALPCANPADWDVLRQKTSLISSLGPYLADDVLSLLIQREFSTLSNVIDVKISRELVILGLYHPGDEPRPDPAGFEYAVDPLPDPDPDDPENPDDTDDTTDEPTDDTPSDTTEKPSKPIAFLISFASILTGFTVMVVYMIFKRRITIKSQ